MYIATPVPRTKSSNSSVTCCNWVIQTLLHLTTTDDLLCSHASIEIKLPIRKPIRKPIHKSSVKFND